MWNPWNWVKGAWNWSFGSIKDLYQWILNQIAAVYDYINSYVTWLEDSISGVVTWMKGLAWGIEQWAMSWFTWTLDWARRTFDGITSWVTGLWDWLWQWIQYLDSFATWVYNYLRNLVWGWITDVYQWVVHNIWDPIWNYVNGTIKWVTVWINYLYQFIQHPEILGELIVRALFKLWYYYARILAAPFARWLVSGFRLAQAELFDLIEIVLSNIL